MVVETIKMNFGYNSIPLINAYVPIITVSSKNNDTTKLASLKNNTRDVTKVTNEDDSVWAKLSEQDKCSYKERILFLLLHTYIQKAINSYYGEIRQYDNAQIIYIKPEKLKHIVQIKVNTFVGAHNPPYGEDNISFQIESSKIQQIEFKHKTG